MQCNPKHAGDAIAGSTRSLRIAALHTTTKLPSCPSPLADCWRDLRLGEMRIYSGALNPVCGMGLLALRLGALNPAGMGEMPARIHGTRHEMRAMRDADISWRLALCQESPQQGTRRRGDRGINPLATDRSAAHYHKDCPLALAPCGLLALRLGALNPVCGMGEMSARIHGTRHEMRATRCAPRDADISWRLALCQESPQQGTRRRGDRGINPLATDRSAAGYHKTALLPPPLADCWLCGLAT